MDYLSKLSTPSLAKEEAEGNLTLQECLTALKQMPGNKSPGNEGLTKEFMLCLFRNIGSLLAESIDYSFEVGELSSSQKQAMIILIGKKESDRRLIKNWRPISLLNVDAKILSKVLATRLKKVIGTLVAPEQSAYVSGRFIGEPIPVISDILEYTDKMNIPCHMFAADIEKAFDSVSHAFLISVLRQSGFGANFIQWIRVLLCNQESCVMNNGHSSGYFKIDSASRQGDPISAFLFILVLEILFIQVNSDHKIEGIRIFSHEIKLSAFADDVTYLLRNLNSLEELLRLLAMCKQFSSLKVNFERSDLCDIGAMKGVEGAFCGVTCLNLLSDSIKILGVHFSDPQSLYNDRNYLTILKSLQEVLNLWSTRRLTLAGRIQVFRTFGISKMLYISYMNRVPSLIMEELKKFTLHLFGRAKKQKLSTLHLLVALHLVAIRT